MNRSRSIIIGLLLILLIGVVGVSVFYTLRTRVDASKANDSFDHEFTISSVRRLSLCEHHGLGSGSDHPHLFVKVQDSNGEGINGVSVKVQADSIREKAEEGFLIFETETKTDFWGQIDAGRLDFSMYKGDYWVQLVDGDNGISGIVGPIRVESGTLENERCGQIELELDGVRFPYSYEIIFTRQQ